MSQALYLKYRPSSFADVVGQDHVVTTLQNEVKTGQIAHAYLFSGPRGVGKTTIARLLAQAVNASTIAQHKLAGTNLMDIIEIDAASNTGVDNVREQIIQNARVSPSQLDYKVFIIDEVHMLSASAFNALLKILEEPPAHVIFILATTEIHKVPATVISRCQRFDFHAAAIPAILSRLIDLCQREGITVEQSVLERIARRAGGAFRDAESMLGQVLSLGDKHITAAQADIVLPRSDIQLVLDLLDCLQARNASDYVQQLGQAVEQGLPVKELYNQLIELLRQCLLYSVDKKLEHFSALDVQATTHERLVKLMATFTTQDCLELLRLFTGPLGQVTTQTRLPQLPLELAGIAWCTGGVQTHVQATKTSTPTQVAPIASQSTRQVAPTRTAAPAQPSKTVTVSPSPIGSSRTPDPALFKLCLEHWPAILAGVKPLNHALAMTLSVVHVVAAYAPHTLQLGVRFGFHRDRLMEAGNYALLCQVAHDVLQRDIAFDCIVDTAYEVDLSVLRTLPSDNIDTATAESVENVWDLALKAQ